MKKSKRYIKKQNNKPLINKKVLAKVIRESNICKHAIKELKLAGYGNGEGGPNDWMYQQVIEAVAIFASHGNSGSSAPWEINLVQKLCDWNIITPLRFTDEEWMQISSDGTCQNRRKGNVFKEPDGSIHYNGAFSKRATGRYFNTCLLYEHDIDKMTASDYTHLFGYLNPYYRSAYNVSKRRK